MLKNIKKKLNSPTSNWMNKRKITFHKKKKENETEKKSEEKVEMKTKLMFKEK